MKEKRILLPNGSFAPFSEKLEKKAIAEGKKEALPEEENKPEISTKPEKSASVKAKHNKKAKKNNEILAAKHQAKKDLDIEK